MAALQVSTQINDTDAQIKQINSNLQKTKITI